MKKLMNTLYVTSEDSYLSLDGENIVISDKDCEIGRLPLHNLEGHCFIWIQRNKPCTDGCVRRTKYFVMLSIPTGKIPRKGDREDKGECGIKGATVPKFS